MISLECILEQNDERNDENLNCFENDQSVLWKLLYIIIYFVYNKINMTISRIDFNSVRKDPLFFGDKWSEIVDIWFGDTFVILEIVNRIRIRSKVS